MMTHELIVVPHILADGHRHPKASVVRLAGSAGLVLCVSETPASTAARLLLERGVARPSDVLVLRHSVGGRAIARGKACELAGLDVGNAPKRLVARPGTGATPSGAPGQPLGQTLAGEATSVGPKVQSTAQATAQATAHRSPSSGASP